MAPEDGTIKQSHPPSYPAYLAAKESVDAGARNQTVWARFIRALEGRGSSLSILEVGGGIGGTALRLLESLEHPEIRRIEYTLVDSSSENVDAAQSRLVAWARDRGALVSSGDTNLQLDDGRSITIRFVHDDLFTHVRAERNNHDAVVAQSLLDLVPAERALRALASRLKPNGLWYLPLHYDGVTAFEPVIDDTLDDRIQTLYNESVGPTAEQEEGGTGAYTGRRLLTRLRSMDAELLDVGPSDWILFPQGDGFTEDEMTFLQTILGFFEAELTGHPEIDAERFEAWLTERRRQLARHELIFITHQLDILARQPAG